MLVCEYEVEGVCDIHGKTRAISFREHTENELGFICEKCFEEVLSEFDKEVEG